MFSAYAAYTTQNQLQHGTPELARERGSALFQRAFIRGMFRRMGWTLTRRPHDLLSLHNIRDQITVEERHYTGIRIVPVAQILGSEGRSQSFDSAFAPRDENSRERWIQVAAARKQRVPLPPVELIQVGDIYFVRDGHHRISVACARGETFIEAEVTEWVLRHEDSAVRFTGN